MAPVGIYIASLKQKKDSILKITKGVYALLVCNEDGFIRDQDNPRYVIIQHTTEGQYGCSCETTNLYNYNTDKKCIHIQVAQQLKFDFQNEDTDKFKSSIKVCQIEQTSLLGIFSAFLVPTF